MLFFPCPVKFVIKALFQATQRQLISTAEVPFKNMNKFTKTVSAPNVSNECSDMGHHCYVLCLQSSPGGGGGLS